MTGVNPNADGESAFTIEAPNGGPNLVCCLFSDVQFRDNVWCVGVGGGDTLPQWKNVAQSISCHAGGNVWLYAEEYGDAGGR